MTRNPLRMFVAVFCALIWVTSSGCAELVPTVPEPKGTQGTLRKSQDSARDPSAQLDPTSWNERVKGLKNNAAKLAAELTELNSQISQIYSIKDAFCRRQANLIDACIVMTPLSHASWKNGATCKSDVKNLELRTFTAEIRGVSGKFQMVLDNSIESSTFEGDKPTTIQWFTRGHRSLRDLKLSDVGTIKLKALEGNLKNLESAVFVFKAADKVVFTEKDFLLQNRTDTAVIVSQRPLADELASANCRVEEFELDEIVKSATSSAGGFEKSMMPEQLPGETAEQSAQSLEDWITEKNRDLRTKSDTYLALAQDLSRLRRNLRGELQLGCWGREIIRNIELRFRGSHLPVADWDRSQTRQPLGSVGNPTQTTIDLGGGLRFTNPDEKSHPIFREDGLWTMTANTDLTIGDISHFQIEKGGYSYQSLKNCWSTWGGLGTACEWQNREDDRYHLSALEIRINDQILYQKDGLNFTIERRSPVFLDKDFLANSAYVELMRRRDCPVSATGK